MLWDDFARVGAPSGLRPLTKGLTLGREAFPEPLASAIAQAGLFPEEAGELAELGAFLRLRSPDFVICHAARLGSGGASALAGMLDVRLAASRPLFLVHEDRTVPDDAAAGLSWSEVFAPGQDALTCFLALRATLRRQRPQALTDILAFGKLTLDQERFVLSLDGTVAPLTKLELCFLGAMLDAPRMVWNKVFMNRIVFGSAAQKPGRQFDTFMSRVRRGIRAKTGIDPIVAERGMGYALSPWALEAPGIGRAEPRPQP
jgi:hypothetical protein